MAWHSVVISSPAKLSRSNFALTIEQEETAKIPFEDIAIIVLNHRSITLSHPVLSACADYGIGLFSTGENYHPNGMFLPFMPHTRTLKVMRKQLALDKPTGKRVWAYIVKAKIENQAKCLSLLRRDNANLVMAMSNKVRSGDVDNIEAQASAIYFKNLFGKGFSRSQKSRVNSALNYGYAIFRGALARVLVAHGFQPAFGIHHRSEQNAFNLADDLIEPFRPLVDLYVTNSFDITTDDDLSPTDKAALVNLLHFDMKTSAGSSTGLVAAEKCVTSLLRVLEQGDANLIELPALLPLALHQNEH